MIADLRDATLDRLAGADPGLVRLRLAGSAVLGIIIAILVLQPLHFPLTTSLVAAIAAMMSAFTVNDPTTAAKPSRCASRPSSAPAPSPWPRSAPPTRRSTASSSSC